MRQGLRSEVLQRALGGEGRGVMPGSITPVAEACCCLENYTNVMIPPFYLEVERRQGSGRGSYQLLELCERPEIQTCPRPQVMWDFLENIMAFQETVLRRYSCFYTYYYKAYHDNFMLNQSIHIQC